MVIFPLSQMMMMKNGVYVLDDCADECSDRTASASPLRDYLYSSGLASSLVTHGFCRNGGWVPWRLMWFDRWAGQVLCTIILCLQVKSS